jgi:hypothetical protein
MKHHSFRGIDDAGKQKDFLLSPILRNKEVSSYPVDSILCIPTCLLGFYYVSNHITIFGSRQPQIIRVLLVL